MQIQQSVLDRSKIDNALKRVFDYPLTIVVAAMGYGKSTAIRAFLKTLETPHCYLSFEGEETSPQFIWSTLTRQLAKYNTALGEQFNALGFPANTSQFDKIIQILDEHTFSSQVLVVIDDYHCCHSSAFDSFISRLVKMSVTGLHIVLLSRTMPDIGTEELRLKGYCHQVPSELFELNVEDIQRFFSLYGHRLSDKLAKEAYEASEGWIAAIYLMLQDYAQTNRIRTGLHIERLIETAVMHRYRDEEIKLLKALSILDTISPMQANYVMEDAMSAITLQRLSEGNAFIRYDDETDVYRIHNIFNSYLRKCIEREPLKRSTEALYRRAGTWCMTASDILAGLTYLSKAKAYDLILKEFEKVHLTKVIDNNPDFIMSIFKKIPEEVRFRYPIAYLSYIGFYVTNIDAVEGERMLQEIEHNLIGTERVTQELEDRIFGEIELIRGYMQFNDVRKMYEYFKRASLMMGGKSKVTNQNKIITFGSPHFLYMYYRNAGGFKSAEHWLSKMFPYYTEMAGGCGKGVEEEMKAELFLESSQFDEAENYALKSIYKAETLQQISVILCDRFILARAALARGNVDRTIEIIDDLGMEIEMCNSPILASAHDMVMGYIGGILGDGVYFSNWIKAGDLESSDVLYQGAGFGYIVYGKYLLYLEDYIKLEVICEDMRNAFDVYHNMLGYLHMHLLSAIAKFQIGELAAAQQSLEQAIDIGIADQLTLVFSEYGKYLLPLFKALELQAAQRAFVDRQLPEIKQYLMRLQRTEVSNAAKPKLTARENEILRHIVSGKINREIAKDLYIAEVTVRKNITSIYRKLEVNGRAAAVKKALEMNLIN
jgi:LuxR family maltose regulon positive regulatory protein